MNRGFYHVTAIHVMVEEPVKMLMMILFVIVHKVG